MDTTLNMEVMGSRWGSGPECCANSNPFCGDRLNAVTIPKTRHVSSSKMDECRHEFMEMTRRVRLSGIRRRLRAGICRLFRIPGVWRARSLVYYVGCHVKTFDMTTKLESARSTPDSEDLGFVSEWMSAPRQFQLTNDVMQGYGGYGQGYGGYGAAAQGHYGQHQGYAQQVRSHSTLL